MRHAFVDIGAKTMCSRCGNEVFRVDEECPAISDGEMYKRHPNIPDNRPAEVIIREDRDAWPN